MDRTVVTLSRALALAALILTGVPDHAAAALAIDRLSRVDAAGQLTAGDASVPLGGWLGIVLSGVDDGTPAIDTANAVLFLDGRPINGLKDTRYLAKEKALVFHLLRNSDNADAWQPLLDAPSFTPRKVVVGLSLTKAKTGESASASVTAAEPFSLVLLSGWALTAGAIAVALVVAAVWAGATRTNILKDALLPQLAPAEQPFSLGRWQMAWWFTLIFAAFVFLFFLLGDYNTLTAQSLKLMGLSGATAIFAVAIDAAKDTPIGAANEMLRAVGLNTYADVLKLDDEIANRQQQLAANPPPDAATTLRLQTEITDRLNRKRTWRDITRPFVTVGWYRDLTTDINGPALHRLQVFVWTLAIGVLFVIEIYRNLSLPTFSDTLLVLMGITSAGYLGFKYPEQQH
jgi:hypothetical protein